ncbi:MAG: mannitol dehydrogenase family protein [Rhodoglobus sp.]
MARPDRESLDAPAAPIRIVHLGLGAFHRAHEAWYTHRANALGGQQWGISAFTGRRPDEALKLAPQDGLYFLVTRSADGDTAELVTSISAVHDGAVHDGAVHEGVVHEGVDDAAWLACFREPSLAILSLTITEAGYAADSTAAGRIVRGLAARRAAGLGGITILSCDNLAGNGAITRAMVIGAADPGLAVWISDEVTFPSTMVDRITPKTTPDDLAIVERLTGLSDASPVVAEPFSDWVIEDDFAQGCPDWAAVGARLVDDVTAYERRKLLLLNGGHSLLAYAGSILGHETVAQASSDPKCVAMLDSWWDEAAPALAFDEGELADYRASILQRWANPRIRHQLAQIATDGALKLPVRIGPVIELHRGRGELPDAAIDILAAWLVQLRRGAVSGLDTAFAANADPHTVIAQVTPALRDDDELVVALTDRTTRWEELQ